MLAAYRCVPEDSSMFVAQRTGNRPFKNIQADYVTLERLIGRTILPRRLPLAVSVPRYSPSIVTEN